MASNERIRKYLDAASVLGQVTRGRAEEIVRELVNAGDIPRAEAQEWVDTMVEQSKKASESVLEAVRREVQAQLAKIDPKAIEEIAGQVAVVLKRSAEAGRSATAGATKQASQAAKDATAGATNVAKEAKRQAEKTAGRARDAAGAAVPKRGKSKKAKNEDKGPKKDKKKKKDKGAKVKNVSEDAEQPTPKVETVLIDPGSVTPSAEQAAAPKQAS